MPTPETIGRGALEDVYKDVKAAVLISMKDVSNGCSITFDAWTDKYNQASYITVTVHYITADYTLKNATLETAILEQPHTGEHIRSSVEAILKKFNIADQHKLIVTDKGANVLKACRLIPNSNHIDCVGHGLHNLLSVDILKFDNENRLKNLIQQTKSIYRNIMFKVHHIRSKMESEKHKKLLDFMTVCENIGKSNFKYQHF